ncbi:MAG: Bacterial lectin, partial [Bacteroidota bacterium]
MSFIKTIFCICLLSLTFQQTNAQFNVATGFINTAIVNGACYRLTSQSETGATGVIWSNANLDLTCNFVKAYNVKFGNSDGGADGMAFIMKNVANYAPTAGSN